MNDEFLMEMEEESKIRLINVPEMLEQVRIECLNTQFSPISWGDWTDMTEGTYGWTEGLVWVTGKPNHGKSTFLINMIIRALENNPDLSILDFTLDDDKISRVSRYISIKENLNMNDVKREGFVTDPATLDKITRGYRWMSKFDRLSIYDVNWIVENGGKPDIEFILKYIRQSFNSVVTRNPNGEILIVLDAFNDIEAKGNFQSETAKDEFIAKELAFLSKELGCRILLTGHVLKHQDMRSATADTMAGHRFMMYNARGVLVIFHPMKENPDKTEMQWTDPFSMDDPLPVIYGRWVKNKMSSANGYQFFALNENSGQLTYLSKEDQMNYLSILK